MGLTRREIVEVLDDPDVTYCAGGNRRMSQRGSLAVLWSVETRIVVTVLYRRIEHWDRAG
jgi:hypothetical protein